jgi:hypothetical protein
MYTSAFDDVRSGTCTGLPLLVGASPDRGKIYAETDGRMSSAGIAASARRSA